MNFSSSFKVLSILVLLLSIILSCNDENVIPQNEECPSSLAGTYSYRTPANSSVCDRLNLNFQRPHGELTGTIDIIALEENIYTISDWSFGTYKACHEALNPNVHLEADSKSLTFKDSCSVILFNGTDLDKYGDLWTFESSIEGKEWHIKWSSTLESGTSVIINPEGWNLAVGQ